jgi:hypothetical protein
VAERRQVLSAIVLAHPALILTEGDVQHPM